MLEFVYPSNSEYRCISDHHSEELVAKHVTLAYIYLNLLYRNVVFKQQ